MPHAAKPPTTGGFGTTDDLTINQNLKYFVRKEAVSHFSLPQKITV